MSRADTWMPLYIGDYLADTMHLDAIEHGAYLLLLMHHWRSGPLPEDDKSLAAIARTTPKQWARISETVRNFFQKLPGGGLIQKRLVEERARVDSIGSKRAEAGRKGAENRWKDDDQGGNEGGSGGGKPEANGMANATDLPMANGRQRPPQLQSQLESKKECSLRSHSSVRAESENPPGKSKRPTPAEIAAAFDRFWPLYPRPVRRSAARAAFRAAVADGEDPAEIVAGLEAALALDLFDYREFPTFVPFPATWIEKGGYADCLEMPREDPSKSKPARPN